MLVWSPAPKIPPLGAAVVLELLPEVLAPNKLPPGAVVDVGDANKGLALLPPNRLPVPAVEADAPPKENPPGVVVAGPLVVLPKRLGACLLSAVAPVVGWPKMLVVGAPDDAGAVDCPNKLPPAPEVPKLKDILGQICRLSSLKMSIHLELPRR